VKRCAGYFNFTGKSRAEAKEELKAAGLSENDCKVVLKHYDRLVARERKEAVAEEMHDLIERLVKIVFAGIAPYRPALGDDIVQLARDGQKLLARVSKNESLR